MYEECLTAKDVQEIYGLNLTENDIKSQFPYEQGELDNLREYEDRGLTIYFQSLSCHAV